MVATDPRVGTESGLQANSRGEGPFGGPHLFTSLERGARAPHSDGFDQAVQPMSLMSSIKSVSPVTMNLYSTQAITAPAAGPAR